MTRRSFEERLAELKKPEPVTNPDQDQVNGTLSRLNAQIEKCDKRLVSHALSIKGLRSESTTTDRSRASRPPPRRAPCVLTSEISFGGQSEIKGALEKANGERDRSKDATKGIVDQLKANRARMSNASKEKERCYQALRDMTASRQAQQKSLQDLRKSLKFQDVGEVESRVRELESMIEQGRCGNLAEEKRTIKEIQQLNQMKTTINQYQTQRSTVVDDSATKADLEARKAAAVAEIDICKKENEKLEKELDSKRSKTTEGAPNANDLWKEQKELYGQIKTHRAEIRTVNGAFKEEVNKWRDYQRALNSYKKAQGKIQQEQRRAEWEARKASEDDPIDKDLPSDDPLVGHPWADEMLMCSDLEKCLSFFLPKEAAKEEAAKTEVRARAGHLALIMMGGRNWDWAAFPRRRIAWRRLHACLSVCLVSVLSPMSDTRLPISPPRQDKAWMKGALSRNDEDNAFASVATKKNKKASKPPGPAKDVKVVLTIDTINSLTTIGVSIPASSEQIAVCIADVKAKREAFSGMSEDDKKNAKKSKASSKSKQVEGGIAGALVSVDITATSADKVKVKIDFPALAA